MVEFSLFNIVTAPAPYLYSGQVKVPQYLKPIIDLPQPTVTARYYCYPMYIDKIEAFAGVKFYNTSSGESGRKVKVALYNEDVPGGGLGTLEKDFGEATLPGSTGIRTLTSSWTPSYTGWYWLALTTDNDISMWGMAPHAGAGVCPPTAHQFGTIASGLPQDLIGNPYCYSYVAGTYANFPESTGLTLTNDNFGTGPAVGLYKA